MHPTADKHTRESPSAPSEAAPAAEPPKDDAAAKREQEPAPAIPPSAPSEAAPAAESSARWTPELRGKVSALMDREWKTTKAALSQAGEAMNLGESGSLDVVLVFRTFHN